MSVPSVLTVLRYTLPLKAVCPCALRTLSSTGGLITRTGEPAKKKKTTPVPKITLISGDSMSITTLEEAQNLSKRRDLKLVKIVDLDTKTQRPVYKLMTGAEYHQEDLKQREQKKKDKQSAYIKGEKVLFFNDNISEHDQQVHLKKILKWLAKSYEVRIIITANSSSMDKAEQIYKFLEQNACQNGAKVVQKRTKGCDMKFQMLPPRKNQDDSDTTK